MTHCPAVEGCDTSRSSLTGTAGKILFSFNYLIAGPWGMERAITPGMNDLNWKTWGLVLIVALGGTFELIKRLPSSNAFDPETLRAQKLQPYAARSNNNGLRRQPPAFLPMGAIKAKPTPKLVPPPLTKEGLQVLLAKQGPSTETNFDEKAKLAKKDDGEWEIVIDPKTGKRVKRKKKKVAKKEEPKKEEPKKIAEEKKEEQKETTDADIEDAIANNLNTGRLNPMPPTKADDAFNSAEDWIKRLLGRPNLAETNRFIDHYRKNLVSAEVFYKVVGMMIEDPRAEMKKLGILACGATPSPLSFQLVAGLINKNAGDAATKQKAEDVLNSYVELSRLAVLERILRGGSPPYATVQAAHKLEASAQKNLSAQATATPSPSPTPAAQQRNTNAYQRFLAILSNLAKISPDAGVKSAANQAHGTLQSLLGSSTPAPAQAAN